MTSGEAEKGIPKEDPIASLPSQVSRVGIITCDRSRYKYDICTINGPNVLNPTISTFFAVDPTNSTPSTPSIEKIKPQPRKWQEKPMSRVNHVTLISGGPIRPNCEIQHSVPALVFSIGNFNGNYWHDFADGLIPLFITVKSFFHDQDFVMVIDQSYDYFINKYRDLLHGLSKQRIIRMDGENTTHCFPWAIIGLITHGHMTINPNWLPSPITLHHFRDFLAQTYGGRNKHTISLHQPSARSRPRLVFACRHHGGRVILNYVEAKQAMEEVGFEVIEFEPTINSNLRENFAIVNSSHALLGVHGAGLTHFLFLRPGSPFLQIVLIGQDEPAEICFRNPSPYLGLDYLEYKINVYESSYLDKYGQDDVVLNNPEALLKDGWNKELQELYLIKQDVKLDLSRFRPYLEETYKKAKRFMEKEG
ncbi:Glycosyltransferase 61 [Dillenia turbinata]|uniref:Glycosyltransferase 61 n=1 Tax=Dillenia turbinata TaxID=194707 RepID=A0AAN8VBU1_9MAGN